jgi:hypothetical protein
VSLPYTAAEDEEAVSKLDLDKEVDDGASDTLEEVDAVSGTDPGAGIPAQRLS